MAIKRQNRTIWGLAIATFLVIASFLVRDGQLAQYFSSEHESELRLKNENRPVATENESQYGDKVENLSAVQSEEQTRFREMVLMMAQCLELPTPNFPNALPVGMDGLIQVVQPALGPVSHQADKWMDWHLRTREGRERRMRLEIKESDLGQITRELHYFTVDRRGQPTPTELDPEKALNPSDEVISQMLKEGEVFQKERSAAVFFANNERIEFVEKDGKLSELLFFKDDHQFRCANINLPQNCLCQ